MEFRDCPESMKAYFALIRTTVDLPDPLFREVKATAAARGQKMKEFVASALRDALRAKGNGAEVEEDALEIHRRRMREHFLRMDAGRAEHAPVEKIDRDSLHRRHD